MLRPDVSTRNADAGGYATPNHVAVEKLVPVEVAMNPAIYPTDEDLARLDFLGVIPDHILPIYDEIWTRLLVS